MHFLKEFLKDVENEILLDSYLIQKLRVRTARDVRCSHSFECYILRNKSDLFQNTRILIGIIQGGPIWFKSEKWLRFNVDDVLI